MEFNLMINRNRWVTLLLLSYLCGFGSCQTTPLTNVRLVDGGNAYLGRVEIYYNGEWGTICDNSFDIHDGDVICRQLGYAGADTVYDAAYFGAGDGPILLLLACLGYESELEYCNLYGWDTSSCSHREDAGLSCVYDTFSPSNEVRLVDGSSPYEGRVEVYYNNEWGTICDDYFTLNDAHVICQQLGYSGALEFPGNAFFGEGNGPILESINCNGYESEWTQCNYNNWGTSICVHSEDVGVTCSDNVATNVRLVNGGSAYEGRVEIYYAGEWGTICDDTFDIQDGDIICHQLGYAGADAVYDLAYFGEGDGPILSDLDCYYGAMEWIDCTLHDWDTSRCSHSEDVALRCSDNTIYPRNEVRLVDADSYEGRVEIYYNNEWGTICDDNFHLDEAHVICKHLGYSGALDYYGNAYFGEGNGPIMASISCNGYESEWRQCNYQDWGTTSCSHFEDVSVTCSYNVAPRSTSPAIAVIVVAVIVILIGICCCVIVAAACKRSSTQQRARTVATAGTQQMTTTVPVVTSGVANQNPVDDKPPDYRDVISSPMMYPPQGTHSNPAYPPQNYPQQPYLSQPLQPGVISYPLQTGIAPYPPQSAVAPYPPQSAVAPNHPYPPAQAYPPQINQFQLYPQHGNPAPTAPVMQSYNDQTEYGNDTSTSATMGGGTANSSMGGGGGGGAFD